MSDVWIPTTVDIAALLTARTIGDSGVEVGDFTTKTRPTKTQVELLIGQASSIVLASVTPDCIERSGLHQSVKSLIALRTAMSVELSYFPEQVGSDTSPFDKYQSMYKDEFDRVITAVDNACSDASGDNNGLSSGMARFRFPDPSPPLEF